MKIGWFTPFVRGSAIAKASHLAAVELSRRCEVEVCMFGGGPRLDTSLPVRHFRSAADIKQNLAAQYDLLVYQLGNHLPYHRDIYDLSQRFPGIVVLHDFVMHHFFASYYLEELRDPDGYVLAMARNHGSAGATTAKEITSGKRTGVWESDEVANFPLFHDTLRGALGIVTHSHFLEAEVRKVFAGPVTSIPLVYEGDSVGAIKTRAELDIPEDAVLVITVGHVNRNKRVDSVIAALSELPASPNKIVYAVVGPCASEYLEHLTTLVTSGGLEKVVRFCGSVPDDILRSYLHHADLCVNLRFPPTEGASASAVEQMLAAKAIIVNTVGFFAELPDDCVVKVEPFQQTALVAALKMLVRDPLLRKRLGIAARAYCTRVHSAERYAEEVVRFAAEVRDASPLLYLCNQVSKEMRQMDIMSDAPLIDSVSSRLGALFGDE